ncbi:MAG: hypothetical protein AAGU21_17195 [Solidesulfovibrio sp.]|uniref:hypothetical protein n=1 Tax=Solidesulfovibrio sp. TaxID=2910990 RepID=UPI002B1F8048|nr:hypothetical protein [Solidesulfovibrio sp.]MEA4858807.1 hypothetical protein [Solidesulfovibrio sp.]
MRPILCCMLALLLLAATAQAADVPDMRGVWRTSAHEGITTGSRHFPQANQEPRFVSGEFTMEITAQEGRRFLGVKKSANHAEKIMGLVAYDNVTVHILEQEGNFHGRLLPDGSMELVYSHDSGGRQAIGIALYIRQKP